MKSYIMKLLYKTSGEISNIIFHVVLDAHYNPNTDKLEVPLSKLNNTSYFELNKKGIIEGTPIHWEVTFENLTFWLK